MKARAENRKQEAESGATAGGPPGLRKKTAFRCYALCLITVSAFCAFPCVLAPARAHEPITTKVRFNKEVVRVLQRNCLGCHHPGGVAMSLATYEEARPWAKAVKEEMLEKRMPPWHVVKGYGEFRNAPLITQREIDLIVNWVEGGAPKGDDKDLPAEPLYSDDWQLGKPDLVLKPEATSKITPDADEYRAATLATNLREDRWIAAIDLRPGNRTIVYSATFYLSGGRSENDSATGSPRDVPGIAASASGPIGTWTPGQRTVTLPEGVGLLLPAGARIVVNIHYKGAGEAAEDRSEVGIYFTKTPPRGVVREAAIVNPDAVIPAGAQFHQVKASFTAQDDTEAVAIRPYVNPLIVSFQATAYRPDGSEEVMIWTRDYGFGWQPTYYFKRAVVLPKGTRVEVIAYFDNSDNNRNNPHDPPEQLRWADLTPDPLCSISLTKPRGLNDSEQR